MFFVYKPSQIPGLEITLRAHPALIALPGSGQALGYNFALSGRAAAGPTAGGVILMTEVEIDPSAVASALELGVNPVIGIFDQQQDLLHDFFIGVPDALASMQAILLEHGTRGGKSRRRPPL